MRILVFDNYDSFTYNLVHLVEKILHVKVEVYRNDLIPMEKVKDYDKIILSPGPGLPVEAGLLLPLIREYASSKRILGVCLGHQAIGEAFGGKLVNLSKVYHGVATPVKIVNREASIVSGEAANVSRETSIVEDGEANIPHDESVASPGLDQLSKKNKATYQQSVTNEHHSRLTIDDSRKNLFRGLPNEFVAGRYHSWIISDEDFPEELDVTARDENNFIMAIRHKNYDVQGVQFHPESVLTPMGEKIMRNWLED